MTGDDPVAGSPVVRRRVLLATVGTASLAGLAGCTSLGNRLCGTGVVPDQLCESEETPTSRDEELLQDAMTAHAEYREMTDDVVMSHSAETDRQELTEAKDDETANLIVEPVNGDQGDRLLLAIESSSKSGSKIASTIVALHNASPEDELVTASIRDREISFVGGEGDDLAVGAGVMNAESNDVDLVVTARAETTEEVTELIKTFDDELTETIEQMW